MKRIIFYTSEILLNQMEEAVFKSGFQSRAEFLRFLIVTYCKQNGIGTTCIEAEKGDEEKDEKLLYGHSEEDFEFGIPLDVIKALENKASEKCKSDTIDPCK